MIGEGASDRRIRVLLRWSEAASTGSRAPAPTVAPGTVSVVDLFPGTTCRRRSRRPQGPEDLFCRRAATTVGVWPGICARLSLGWIPARLPRSCRHPEVRLLQGPGGHAEDLLPLRKPAVFLFLCLCDNPTRRARGGACPRNHWRETASGPTEVGLCPWVSTGASGCVAVLASVGLPCAARLGPIDPAGPGDVWTLVLVVLCRVSGGATGGLRDACLGAACGLGTTSVFRCRGPFRPRRCTGHLPS